MKPFLKNAFKVSDSFLYAIGCMAIANYASDHWPTGYRWALYIFVAGLAACYFWRFFVQPFKAGLRGEEGDERKNG